VDAYAIVTTNNDLFTEEDQVRLANLIFKRFGKEAEAATNAWNRMLGNNCSIESFMLIVNKKETAKYHIEEITSDNRRPGMPQEGFLVRYRPHPDFGWLSCKTVDTKEEAEMFADILTPEGDLPPK